jgi:hypothetical protein
VAEQTFGTEEMVRAADEEIKRNLARAVTARDTVRETGAASEEDDRALQSMFEDIDAILARLESGIAVERTALDALLDRLSNAA